MKIKFSAVVDIKLVGDSNSTIIADEKHLMKLDGVHDKGEFFCDYLDHLEEDNFHIFDNVQLKDNGIQLEFDKSLKKLKYVTIYESDQPLSTKQLKILQEHTLILWQEGIGVNFNQLVLQKRYGYMVLKEDYVGDKNMQMEIE